MRTAFLLVAAPLLVSCTPQGGLGIDPQIARAVAEIEAVDHHAHPFLAIPDVADDHDFDAVKLAGLEPFDMPVNLRRDHPAHGRALQALWGSTDPETALEVKSRRREELGDAYPEWVLDQLGIDLLLANRVRMGTGLEPPRFQWVAFADALLYPLDNGAAKRSSPDYDAFYTGIERLRRRQLEDLSVDALPDDLDGYLETVVVPVLEGFADGGALAIKFIAAYLRTLDFAPADREAAAAVYAGYRDGEKPPADDYKLLQDFLFRFISRRAGELGLAVHVHTGAGGGSYFHNRHSRPLLLESAVEDPALRATRFVLIHGGWPFTFETPALLYKPNVYADFSAQAFLTPPRALSRVLRDWLSWVPEKILFGTDAYPYAPLMGWEESAWMWNETNRTALALALTEMVRDGEVTRPRATELARMVLRDNALRLYGLDAGGGPTPQPTPGG